LVFCFLTFTDEELNKDCKNRIIQPEFSYKDEWGRFAHSEQPAEKNRFAYKNIGGRK